MSTKSDDSMSQSPLAKRTKVQTSSTNPKQKGKRSLPWPKKKPTAKNVSSLTPSPNTISTPLGEVKKKDVVYSADLAPRVHALEQKVLEMESLVEEMRRSLVTVQAEQLEAVEDKDVLYELKAEFDKDIKDLKAKYGCLWWKWVRGKRAYDAGETLED